VDARRKAFQGRFQSLNARQLRHAVETAPVWTPGEKPSRGDFNR